MILNREITKTKVVDLKGLYNFLIDIFFHLKIIYLRKNIFNFIE
jgi:hypothetical protein